MVCREIKAWANASPHCCAMAGKLVLAQAQCEDEEATLWADVLDNMSFSDISVAWASYLPPAESNLAASTAFRALGTSEVQFRRGKERGNTLSSKSFCCSHFKFFLACDSRAVMGRRSGTLVVPTAETVIFHHESDNHCQLAVNTVSTTVPCRIECKHSRQARTKRKLTIRLC